MKKNNENIESEVPVVKSIELLSLTEVLKYSALIASLAGFLYQVLTLLRLNALEFFSWGQLINDSIAYLGGFSLLVFTTLFLLKLTHDKSIALWKNLLGSFVFAVLLLIVVSLIVPKIGNQLFVILYPILFICLIMTGIMGSFQVYKNGEGWKGVFSVVLLILVYGLFIVGLFLYSIYPEYKNEYKKTFSISGHMEICEYMNDKFVFCKNDAGTGITIFPLSKVDKVIK